MEDGGTAITCLWCSPQLTDHLARHDLSRGDQEPMNGMTIHIDTVNIQTGDHDGYPRPYARLACWASV